MPVTHRHGKPTTSEANNALRNRPLCMVVKCTDSGTRKPGCEYWPCSYCQVTDLTEQNFICVLGLKTVATSWDYTNDEEEMFKNHAQAAVQYILCVSFIV